MKKVLRITLMLVLSALLIGSIRASAVLAQAGSISGSVTQADGVTPIAGAWVYALDDDFDFIKGTNTEADGSYQIDGLSSGNHYVAARASGYGGVYYDNGYDNPHATQVAVVDPGDTPNIDFHLSPEATVSGHVYQSDGTTPIANAQVEVWPKEGGQVRGATTTATGSYTVTGLSTGTYMAEVQAGGYTTEYYENARLWDDATPISVTQPSDTGSIDFVLETAGSISGHVFKVDGTTIITDVRISVHAHGISAGTSGLDTDVSQVDGSYTISGLAPGTYKVQANNNHEPGYVSKYYDDELSWDDADTVQVLAGQTTSGINFNLEAAGSISGYVFKADGTTPIAGVNVRAEIYDGGDGRSTQTDTDGNYVIYGLAAHDYRVRVEPPPLGYAYEYYDDTYDWEQAARVSLTAGATISDINFTLAPGGSVSGHVYNVSGTTPLGQMHIAVNAADGRRIHQGYWTESDGSFYIVGLPYGDYKVEAEGRVEWGSSANYAREYWQEKPTWDEADIVTVSAMVSTVVGIDFTLEQGASISGHVYESDGVTPIEGADVWAAGPDAHYVYHTTSQADGSYTISGLLDNDYTVKARADDFTWEWYQEKDSHWEADTVAVSAPGDTPGIDFTLSPAGSISGHIFKADGTTVITDVQISVHAHGLSAGGSSLGTYASQVDGSYTISGLAPGTYRVQANNNLAPDYVTKYYNDKPTRDQADTIEVLAGQTTSGIDFNLEAAGVITGYVYTEDGVTPVANACVNVSSTAPDWNQVLGWCCTDANGAFNIGSLATGSYYLRTHANCRGGNSNLQNEWYAAGGSTSDGNQATPVAVVAGGVTSNITFTLDTLGTITGIVYDASGSNPISRAGVGITTADNPSGYWSYCADENGRFSLSRAYGSYKVFARGDSVDCGSNSNYAREYWQEVAYWDDADVVTLTLDAPTVAVTFTLEMGGSIAGTVYDATGTNSVGGAVVMAQSVDQQLTSFVCAESDGTYVIPGLLLGDYKVYARGYCRADPNYITEYWEEKINWDEADVVTLSESQREVTGTNFTLDLGGAISGQVLKADGVTPVQGACVDVSSTAPEMNLVSSRCCTDSEGRFTIRTLPVGDVYVRTRVGCQGGNSDLQDEWYAVGGSTVDASLADKVTVVSGQVVTGVNFTLDPASSAVVLPSGGGVLSTTADVTTTVSFPPDTVSESVTVTLKIIASQSISSGFSFLGQSFSIEATAIDGTSVTTFTEPFTITIHYDDADVEGIDEESLKLYYWDSDASQWVELSGTLDTDANTITVVLDHLTDFAAFGKSKHLVYLPLVVRSD